LVLNCLFAMAELFRPSSQHGAFPPQLYRLVREDIRAALPQFANLSDFLDAHVIRAAPGEEERAVSALTMPEGAVRKSISEFNYIPMIEESMLLAERHHVSPTADTGPYLFAYRAVARHLASMYLHIDQYCSFHKNYVHTENFLDQDFGLARESVPEHLETLVLETEKATRGYGPEYDTTELLKQGKLSFVLAYPDYAVAYMDPLHGPSDVHKLEPVAYMLGGEAEKYFKLMHLAVESKLGPLVRAAEAMIQGAPSKERAVFINQAADIVVDTVSAILKMPEVSDPNVYLHLRWFIQGPYGSPSYPNGLTVRGIKIAPGGETGSQSSFAIMSDLLSGARFHFQDDQLSKMEEIHRVTREQQTMTFLDRLWVAARKSQDDCTDAEKQARARLLQATNFYLLGHAAAYTIHVLAQQKSTVSMQKKEEEITAGSTGNFLGSQPAAARKEDVATGGSAGSFLIKKVIERQEHLDNMIVELRSTSHQFPNEESNDLFKKQLLAVRQHTEGQREAGLDLTILRKLVGFSEEKAVGITAPATSLGNGPLSRL